MIHKKNKPDDALRERFHSHVAQSKRDALLFVIGSIFFAVVAFCCVGAVLYLLLVNFFPELLTSFWPFFAIYSGVFILIGTFGVLRKSLSRPLGSNGWAENLPAMSVFRRSFVSEKPLSPIYYVTFLRFLKFLLLNVPVLVFDLFLAFGEIRAAFVSNDIEDLALRLISSANEGFIPVDYLQRTSLDDPEGFRQAMLLLSSSNFVSVRIRQAMPVCATTLSWSDFLDDKEPGGWNPHSLL